MFPELYHLGKNGALYSWKVWTEGDTIYSDTGQVNGKRVLSVKKATPKNTGKANATTASEQALKEARAMHKHKVTRKYSLTKEEAQSVDFGPMLAQSFEKRKNKIIYPVSVQRKYNGVRALCVIDENNKAILSSRGSKEWVTVEHINSELESVLKPGDVVDGEIYLHSTEENLITFQQLMSLVKKKQSGTEKLEYHIYDIASKEYDDSLEWSDRQKNLEEFFNQNKNLKYLKFVPTYQANSEEEVLSYEKQFVSEGFEGAMVRLNNAKYLFNYRSDGILKVKSFLDSEFLIIGVEPGIGKFSNCAIFILETIDNKKFKAVPKTTQLEKESMLKNSKDYIGKMATVKYFGFSDDGIPIFPVLLGFRPDEDLSN